MSDQFDRRCWCDDVFIVDDVDVDDVRGVDDDRSPHRHRHRRSSRY